MKIGIENPDVIHIIITIHSLFIKIVFQRLGTGIVVEEIPFAEHAWVALALQFREKLLLQRVKQYFIRQIGQTIRIMAHIKKLVCRQLVETKPPVMLFHRIKSRL